MAIALFRDQDIDCMVFKYKGLVKDLDLNTLLKAYLNHPDFTQNINILHDMSEAQLDLSAQTMQMIGEQIQTERQSLGSAFRSAIVVSRPIDYGQMRQFIAYYPKESPIAYQLFYSLDDAKTWLTK